MTWHLDDTSLPLYRDGAGGLTLQEPPPIMKDLGTGFTRPYYAPFVARRVVSVAEYWAAGNLFEAVGPAGIRLGIGPHTVSLSCWPRWWTFLAETTVQATIRHVCHELAQIVGSPLAIYIADEREPIDAIYAGATIAEIVVQLHTELGPPEPALTVLGEDTMGEASRRAYYLDTFADL